VWRQQQLELSGGGPLGVMADTQWTGVADDGKNPNSVAVDIINQVDTQFIAKGVKFVVQVGDLTDNGSVTALDTTAAYRQALYNNGIGFFPLRGNHEYSTTAATEFVRVFPQSSGGSQNATPTDVWSLSTLTDTSVAPLAVTGSTFTVGSNFKSPSSTLKGLSYAFDYNNAHFVILDQWDPASAFTSSNSTSMDSELVWVNSSLATRTSGTHAFVFGHKGIINENHVDGLFGSNPLADAAGQNTFIQSLADNGVRYYMGGHDHIHNRSIYKTTDGTASVQDIICASDSSKFYIPANPSNDTTYNAPYYGNRQTQLAQELNTLGYYIYTVDGSRVTADYYSAVVNPTLSSGEYLISTTPTLSFTKRESFGYSLNGKEFVVAQGGAYTTVQDGVAKILSGTNGSTSTDGSGRSFSHAVNTGWTTKTTGLYTDILTLWGMANTLGSTQTDTYCLSLGYDSSAVSDALAQTGQVGIATKGSSAWVNAVGANTGSTTTTFVIGAYDSTKHGLGTWGVNLSTHTFWAVINYNGDFAVAPSI